LNKAVGINPRHAESLAYLNLLYREKSKWIDYGDKKARDEDIQKAEDYRNRAVQILEDRKKPSSGGR
jgi:hypothetical protein